MCCPEPAVERPRPVFRPASRPGFLKVSAGYSPPPGCERGCRSPRPPLHAEVLRSSPSERLAGRYSTPGEAPQAGRGVIGGDRRRGQQPAVPATSLKKPLNPGGPERNRTSDTRFRKPLLYPLSYGAVESFLILSRLARGSTGRFYSRSNSAAVGIGEPASRALSIRLDQAWSRAEFISPTSCPKRSATSRAARG